MFRQKASSSPVPLNMKHSIHCQGASGVNNSTGVKVSSASEADRQLTTMLQFCYSSSDEVRH